MKYTNKDLFEIALGQYTSNANETVDDILENDDWAEVVLWQPFENWEVNDIHSLVIDLQEVLIEIRDNK